MPNRVNIAAVRQQVSYMRGEVADARAVDADSARSLITMIETLLDVVEQYQAEPMKAQESAR